MRTTKLLAAAGTLGLALSATPALAVNGHYVGGVEGTKGASVPPEGLYYRGYLVQYEIDSIQDDDSNDVPLDNEGSVTALARPLLIASFRQRPFYQPTPPYRHCLLSRLHARPAAHCA